MDQYADTAKEEGAAFDRVALLESVRGKMPLLNRIIDVFLSEYIGLLTEVQRAIESDDARSLERAAHRLNGTLIAMTAHQASVSAHALERMGRSADLSEARPIYDILATRVDALQRELRAMVAENAGS